MSQRQFAEPLRAEPEVLRTADTAAPQRSGLVVGHAADTAEREADRVADEVVQRLQGGEVHQHSAGCEHARSDISRAASPTAAGPAEVGYEGGELSGDLSARINGARGGGRVLDEPVRREMESAFGTSLSGVRIHTGDQAAELNRSISARAFTTGRDIFFGAGEYRPDTADGKHMLAHELAHTQQQGGSARRIHRKWNDVKARDFDLTKATKAQHLTGELAPVIKLTDNSGAAVVVKGEKDTRISTGLSAMAEHLHGAVGKNTSVEHRALPAGRVTNDHLVGLLRNPHALVGSKWAELGADSRKHNDLKGVFPQDVLDAMSDTEYGARWEAEFIEGVYGNASLLAMSFSDASTIKQTASQKDNSALTQAQGKSQSRMRGIFEDHRSSIALGRAHAIDCLMNNKDRFHAPNIGNWMFDADNKLVTIDHIDPFATRSTFDAQDFGAHLQSGAKAGDFGNDDLIGMLHKAKRGNLATYAITQATATIKNSGEDTAWFAKGVADSFGDSFVEGIEEAIKSIKKTFTATRWNATTSSKKNDRSLKKSLKGSAREAMANDKANNARTDLDDDQFWNVLKARGKWIAKNA